MAIVRIPEALLKFTAGQSELVIEIHSLPQLSRSLLKVVPQLHSIVFTPSGKLCGFVNLYLDGQLISSKLDQPVLLTAESKIDLVAAVSGG